MAIIKNETLPNGIEIEYWRITSLTIIVNKKTTIELSGYLSQEKRDSEQEAEDTYKITRFIELDYDPNMSVTKAYSILKTLPEYEEANDVIDNWIINQAYYLEDVVMFEDDKYECLQAHISQADWTPPSVPALWRQIGEPGVIPEWVQPTGAQDAYNTGDKVIHNEKTWESLVDSNVWEPGTAGTENLWKEI